MKHTTTIINNFLHFLGFNFTVSVVGFFLSVISGFLGYIGVLYFDNIDMFRTIAIVVAFDWLIGMYKGWYFGKFSTRKAMKVVQYLLTYWAILIVVLSMEKSHPAASFMSEAVFLPILLFQFASGLKNASLVGLIPQGLLLKILEAIDKHKDAIAENISSFGIKKEEEPTETKDEEVKTTTNEEIIG